MLGERGLWYKQSLREGSVRVPLIVRLPDGAPRPRVRTPVSLLDLLPTLLDVASAGAPVDYVEPVAGRSLLPLFAGDAADAGDAPPVLAEYSAEGTFAPCLMVRKGRHKLISCETDPDLLFDLAEDPDELCNLAGNPDHAAILAELRATLLRAWDPPRYRREALASQRRHRFIHEVLARAEPNAWVFQPVASAREQYVRSGANTTSVKGQARLPFVAPAQPDKPRS